jgi:hypothetical protein
MPRALCTCTTRGSDSFTVPAGVSSVILDVVGAEGGIASLLVMPPTAAHPRGISPVIPAAMAARPPAYRRA